MSNSIVSEAIRFFGGRQKVADIFGLSYMAVSKWDKQGHFPHTDYSGRTQYAETLAKMSNGKFTKSELLPQLKTPSGN